MWTVRALVRGALGAGGGGMARLPAFRHVGTAAAAATTIQRPTRTVAVVGAGPAGFYTADRLLVRDPDVRVDMIERWPVPFGLVRYGVAPDHPEVKHCTSKFEQLLADPAGRCRLVGGVALGRDVTLAQLQAHYDAVVLAYGAEGDRRMGVAGEDLAGVHSAREFVGWYNGAPDCAHLPVNLDVERAVVVGVGNVALDIARILLSPVDLLRQTDIADHALAALAKSRVRYVDLVARRGPVQVAFTIKEFRELVTLPCARAAVHRADVAVRALDAARPVWEKERARRRLLELVEKTARQSQADAGTGSAAMPAPIPASLPDVSAAAAVAERLWTLRFLQAPAAILPDATGTRAAGVRLQTMALDPTTQAAAPVPGAATEDLPAGLVVRSIGYESLPVPGVPFDVRRGLVPNTAGRVGGRLYVAGWLRTGPVGVIASTLANAHETADAILTDWAAGAVSEAPSTDPRPWLDAHLQAAGVRVVPTRGWHAIDAAERDRGAAVGRPRIKVVDVDEMHRLAQPA